MKKGWMYIVISTILFSTMEIALKEIAGDFNPMQLTMTRFLAGGICHHRYQCIGSCGSLFL